MFKTKEVEHVCSSSNQDQQADEEFLTDARPSREVPEAKMMRHHSDNWRAWVAVIFAAAILSLAPLRAQENEQTCKAALIEVEHFDALGAFGYLNGVADFIDAVQDHPLGKKLSGCPSFANLAWDKILNTTSDPKKSHSSQEQLRVGMLLVVYSQNMQTGNYDKLKAFLRLRPWTKGFKFASSVAIDAVLAQQKDATDPKRNTVYHSYTNDQMESVLKTYVK